MSFDFVASQIIVVSLPIVLGWIAHRRGIMDDRLDEGLSRIVLDIGLPCMILATLTSSDIDLPLDMMLWVIAGSALLMVVALALGYAVTAAMRAPRSAMGAYRFTVTFSNCGLIGFPIISALLGPDALLVATIGLIPANIMVFTAGVMMFAPNGDGWRTQLRTFLNCCTSPTLIASLMVCAGVLLGIHDLGVVGGSLSLIGQMAAPMALLLTGSTLARYDVTRMLVNWRAYVAAAFRLFVAPVAGLLLLRLLPLEQTVCAILVLEAAMPAGTNGILYSLRYGTDTEPMAQGLFLSVAGALVSVPAVTMLLV